MKVVFATIGNTRDIRRGSGTPYYLWQSLLKAGVEVHLVGPLIVKIPLISRLFKWCSKKARKRYLSYRDPFVGKRLGSAVRKSLGGIDYDVLLTNDYSIAGYVGTKKPVVLYTDDAFLKKYSDNINPRLGNLSFCSAFYCQLTTKRGLQKADMCCFASQFALDAAVDYGFFSEYKVIPYGANIDDVKDEPERSIEKIVKKGRIDLLFVGKDWEGKGGQVAVKVATELNNRGVESHLHVVGVDLSDRIKEDFVYFYGLLNKDVQSEKEQLEALYRACDVLIIPSKAEGYGLVFVEAAAYGMPSLAYDSTGVKTSVKNGSSGILLAPGTGPEGFAEVILNWFKNPDSYQHLCHGARAFYESDANWAGSVQKLIKELESLLKSKA